ncbi:MAG TPA: MBL fold metallo-hydrolase [Bacillota bacterium]|nr:MBL fold metallo-hydrolase [Bacillota bacterium]
MELTVLGCWAPYPRAGGACSGYLVREDGVNVLLEAGNGVLSNLLKFVDFRCLDAVIISHLHHDHYLDLYSLRQAMEAASRTGAAASPLKLFLPSSPAAVFKELAGYEKAFQAFEIENLPEEKTGKSRVRRLELGGLIFSFAPAKHSLPGFCISVEGSRRLVYSGDTAKTEELVALAGGADLFLCEASGFDRDRDYLKEFHLTARQAGEAACEAGVRRLLLTHFWPEYDPAGLCAEAAGSFGGRVETVREGETYLV